MRQVNAAFFQLFTAGYYKFSVMGSNAGKLTTIRTVQIAWIMSMENA